jgi:hypothetical protein
VPSADPRTHPRDFFDVDLEVEVPEGWLVAGPGRRREVGDPGGAARFRFRPGAPVPQVGLLASRFERRAIELEGVELEILVNRRHLRNLRFFADAGEAIEDRLRTRFADAAALGLRYPYDGLSLVESPAGLRGDAGDWRMDSTQAMPGVLLLRENSFPTARFEFGFRNPEGFEEREGGLASAKVQALERFFENDFSGGNLFLGAARNFFLFQTGAHGDGAVALDFVLEELERQGVPLRYDATAHEQTAVESAVIEMEAELQAARLLTWRAAAMMTRGKPNSLEASMAKAKAGLAVTRITQKAVEILGPTGYSKKLLVEKWMRDAKINDIYEGTQQINQLIVARRILDYPSSMLR